MLLGASYGAALARRRHTGSGDRASVGLWLRRVVAGITAVALVFLAAWSRGRRAPSPSSEPTAHRRRERRRADTVNIGGHDLAMMIRGVSTDNPVLLFLAGGPGGTELGAMRQHSGALEEDFTVATLDQRGTGRPTTSSTPPTRSPWGAVSDTIAVTDYLRDRFGQDKVYLVGQSWGSILGVLAAQQQPELYRGVIGAGQMVSPRATDRIIYRTPWPGHSAPATPAWCDRSQTSGPPPYTSILDYEPALSHETGIPLRPHAQCRRRRPDGRGHLRAASTACWTRSTSSPRSSTCSRSCTRSCRGSTSAPSHPARGPGLPGRAVTRHPGARLPAEEWFTLLDAPSKQLTSLDTSGHRPLWEQPEQFHDLMTTVLHDTSAEADQDN